ncbi:alpha/beta hydrolase-fold protein [Shewanella woodyi]|uniref:alpha/beta hydrolase-fold protein n=1 Tax=Shewanella woodyi TaxID=60961 RepID=UPI0007F97498|nr:alpha/beta hydrolase-fold protein [Shewanella woodyi]
MLKTLMLSLSLLFILVLSTASVNAQNGAEQKLITTLDVVTSYSDEPITFNVTLPPSYFSNNDKRYLVLFDFHPRSQAYLNGMHDWMSHNGDWPWLETIIVTAPDGDKTLGELKELAIEERGDTKLLDFMELALLPAIDKQYRTNGFRIMSGFTGNAGLGLYTLINRPELFNAYFVASPVLSKDFAFVIKDAPKKLAAMKGKSRFLFMSTSDSGFEQRQLTSFAEMEAIVKASASPALEYHIKRFDGSYYMTQPILATAYGIELLFNDYHKMLEPDSEISSRGPQAILAHYQYLTDEKYGFEVPATASLIALAKYEADKGGKAAKDKAITIYQVAVEAYPHSHTAHHALAQAYAEVGEFERAVTHEKLALKNTDHPFWRNKYSKSLAAFERGSLL